MYVTLWSAYIVETQGVDSLYNVRSNVCVRRVIIWGISIHTTHKGKDIIIIIIINTKKGW